MAICQPLIKGPLPMNCESPIKILRYKSAKLKIKLHTIKVIL